MKNGRNGKKRRGMAAGIRCEVSGFRLKSEKVERGRLRVSSFAGDARRVGRVDG